MSKNITPAEVAAAFRLIAAFYEQQGGVTTSTSSAAADVTVLDEEDTKNLPIKELRALAVELELEEQKQKAGILAELEAKGHFGESDDEDDEEDFEDEDEADEDDDEEGDDDSDDEDEDDEEESEYDRDELEEMSLADLRKIAKSEGHSAADYRGKDQDALIDLILGEDEEADEDEDDEEEEEIDEDTLKSMDLTQLKSVAKELGLTIPARIAKNKAKIVEFILDNAAEGDDE
ncbi:hypothetical protein [Streptomyces sp. NPDC006477]|uniref:hypothetical protein n=1 Tax=Streptomyces sp. NPDC006477 TaxID=3364747 RepID=UPI0036C53E48